jgi:hypothetical protein
MSVTGLAASYYTLQRTSPYLLDPVTASGSGHSPSRTLSSPSSIQVRAEAAGTVVVAGTVDGSSTSETLTFTAAGYKSTGRRFSAVTTLTPTGAIIGTTFSAKALASDGSPNPKMKSNVSTGLPGAFSPGAPKWAAQRDAKVESRQAMIAFDWRPDLEIRRADFLVDEQTSERWKVEGTNLFRGGVMPHHWEVHVSLWDGEAPE